MERCWRGALLVFVGGSLVVMWVGVVRSGCFLFFNYWGDVIHGEHEAVWNPGTPVWRPVSCFVRTESVVMRIWS